ncbi:hypothetical protein V1517DRAFT_339937 [Lipomyces orientalis]|uniref:Uncharacterized protein n=1 Tax=Lipomyces orientalis TaxID=1233043 RepID=A0ACC3TMD8_9ASCO
MVRTAEIRSDQRVLAVILGAVYTDVKRWALTYDVACAMDKAFKTFELNEGMALSIEVVYNPMPQPSVFGMTNGERIETALSGNSHLVRLTRTAGRNSRMQILQSHAEHHPAQAKLRQGTRLCSRYHYMWRKLLTLRHGFQLTGHSEDKLITSLDAEKEYLLSNSPSSSQQYLELFESIQGITDIETHWNAPRQMFNDGDEIRLPDMRDFVEKKT